MWGERRRAAETVVLRGRETGRAADVAYVGREGGESRRWSSVGSDGEGVVTSAGTFTDDPPPASRHLTARDGVWLFFCVRGIAERKCRESRRWPPSGRE